MGEHIRLVRGGPVVEGADEESPSFEAFFEAEYPGLFGAVCLVTRNRYEAEDVTQDAFVSLFERWDRIGGIEDPKGYLYRTAMNAFRKRSRRAALALRRALGAIPDDDAIAAIDAQDATVRALAPLTPRQRAAVVLIDLLGYRSEEAARIIGVSASTLRVHAARAHATLRTTLGDQR